MNTAQDTQHPSSVDAQRSSLEAAVITVSDRSAAGERDDLSGPAAREVLESAGFRVSFVATVPDSRKQIRQTVKEAIDSGVAAILLTGGTGIAPRDKTPQAVAPLLTMQLPGIGEELRRRGVAARAPGALLSRGFGGIIREKGKYEVLVIAAPGSVGGAKDGAELLVQLGRHAAHQLAGGDHGAGDGASI